MKLSLQGCFHKIIHEVDWFTVLRALPNVRSTSKANSRGDVRKDVKQARRCLLSFGLLRTDRIRRQYRRALQGARGQPPPSYGTDAGGSSLGIKATTRRQPFFAWRYRAGPERRRLQSKRRRSHRAAKLSIVKAMCIMSHYMSRPGIRPSLLLVDFSFVGVIVFQIRRFKKFSSMCSIMGNAYLQKGFD